MNPNLKIDYSFFYFFSYFPSFFLFFLSLSFLVFHSSFGTSDSVAAAQWTASFKGVL
jgi:hypothetical protein